MLNSGPEDLLRYLTEPVEEEIPEGWKTASQMAKELGRSHCRVMIALKEGIEKGLVETRMFKVRLNTMSRPVQHFRILQKKKRK